jgi:GntR family transcriptional regulator/MocR family aminotransferase
MTVYRQIYQRIKTSIEEGKMKAGDRLPAARTLASELGVARGTVDAAYALLSGEGYVVIRRGRGGAVVAADPPATPRPPAPARSFHPRSAGAGPRGSDWSLLPGVPALDLFPRTIWTQLVSRRARRLSPADFAHVDATGSPDLRASVASYLAVARGVDCRPEQILITGGYQQALGLLLRLLVKPGAEVWVEDPGYRPTRLAVETVGAIPVAAPVDRDGLDVDAAMRLSPRAALCIVTPAHQFPLGASLSQPRREALLEWAGRTGGWIVEDDYEGEFRHRGRALPSLKSLDRDDRVFYVGTFSKTIFPALRLGYVVAPSAEVARVAETLRWLDGGRPAFEQAVVADFIAEGHFARHLQRMRRAYDGRRTAMATALTDSFDGAVQVDPAGGGLHLVMRLETGASDRLLSERAGAAGLRTVPLSPMSWAGDHGQALLVGFGATPERHARGAAERLRAAIA